MRHVEKHQLQMLTEQSLSLLVGSQLLDVQVREAEPILWVLVDNDQTQRETRTLRMYITEALTSMQAAHYIATFQQGPFDWHVFEVKPNHNQGTLS